MQLQSAITCRSIARYTGLMYYVTLTCLCVQWKVTLMSLMLSDIDTPYLRRVGPSYPHILDLCTLWPWPVRVSKAKWPWCLMVFVDRDFDTLYLRGMGPSIPHIRCNTFVSFDQDRRTLVTVYFRPIVKWPSPQQWICRHGAQCYYGESPEIRI